MGANRPLSTAVIALACCGFWGCLVSPDESLYKRVDAKEDWEILDSGISGADAPLPDGPLGDGPAPDAKSDATPPDALPDAPPDSLAPDALQPDTLQPDMLQPDTLSQPDGFKADAVGPGGALPIYRSVGPGSTAALADGVTSSNPLIVSGTLATFAKSLVGEIGVGDVIQYDSDGDNDIDANDALAFIYWRYSGTQYGVRTANSGVPPKAASTTVWHIFRAYTSIADAVTGNENTGIVQGLRNFDSWTGGRDLVASNEVWQIACYADATETQPVKIAGWTTSAKNYLRIFAPAGGGMVGGSQRHTGIAGTGFVINPGSTVHVIDIQSDHVRIEGIEITGWVNEPNNNSWEGVHVAADHALLQDLIVHDDKHPTTSNPNADGINLNAMADGQSVTIRNCMIYNISRGAINYQGALALTVTIENCTIHNTGTSLAQADGQGGLNISSAVSTLNVTNTISVGSGAGLDFKTQSAWGSSSNNLSSDGSAPGTGSLLNKAATGLFTVLTSGAEDLHLATGAEAIDKGKDLSSKFKTDIDGQLRSGTWDIGADER